MANHIDPDSETNELPNMIRENSSFSTQNFAKNQNFTESLGKLGDNAFVIFTRETLEHEMRELSVKLI